MLSLSGILDLEFEADEDPVAGNLPKADWEVDFANLIDRAGVGQDDHAQSSYAPRPPRSCRVSAVPNGSGRFNPSSSI